MHAQGSVRCVGAALCMSCAVLALIRWYSLISAVEVEQGPQEAELEVSISARLIQTCSVS